MKSGVIITISTFVANQIENNRRLPASILATERQDDIDIAPPDPPSHLVNKSDTMLAVQPRHPSSRFLLSTAQYLWLAASCVKDLGEHSYVEDYPVPDVADPSEPYPAMDLDESIYGKPLSVSEYRQLAQGVIDALPEGETAPDRFSFASASLRYDAMVHYLASILRFVDFYGFLPASLDVKVPCPVNLQPQNWGNLPTLQDHLSAITHHVKNLDPLYYLHGVIDFEMFRLARDIVGDQPIYEGLRAIFNFVKIDTWTRWGYAQTFCSPFTPKGLKSAREALAARLSTSGGHDTKMVALYRSLGVPAFWYYVYLWPEERWLNTDVHLSFYDDPLVDEDGNMWEGSEARPVPSRSEPFIRTIRSVIDFLPTCSEEPIRDRAAFMNASDVEAYGVENIVGAAAEGGLTRLILTVKTPYGDLYGDPDLAIPEELTKELSIGGQPVKPFQAAALDPLLLAAQQHRIEVYLGFSVLTDYHTGLRQHRELPSDNPNWSQWDGEYPWAWKTGMISPCIDEYRALLEETIRAYLDRYSNPGVVLMDARWLSGRLDGVPLLGHNPGCTGTEDPDWYETKLVDYVAHLCNSIRAYRPGCRVGLLSASLGKGNANDGPRAREAIWCGQDLIRLAEHVDEVIINVGGYYWLVDRFYDELGEFRFDFEWLTHQLRAVRGLDVSVAFNLRDEWEYPPDFFNGLARYLHSMDISGVSLFSMASAWARWGPAFTLSQWDKIRRMGFNEPQTPYGFAGRSFERKDDGGTGRPIRGVEITFTRHGLYLTRTAITDDKGYYRQPLSRGYYVVTATHSGYKQFTSAPGFYVVTGREGFQTRNVVLSRESPFVVSPPSHR